MDLQKRSPAQQQRIGKLTSIMDFSPPAGGFVPSGTTDLATLKAYLDTLFAGVEWSGGQTISLLGIGEKGTPKEGVFRERKFIDPSSPFMLAQAEGHLNRWGQNGIASFIVPAVLAGSAMAEGDVKLDKVMALTSIVVDIDSGDTLEKLDHAREWLGEPSLLVHSGGVTECEAPKSHAYWMLDGPSSAVAEVARLRKLLAAKIGGDQSFGRATQVIRVPGSIYGKGGAHRPVRIVAQDPKRHALEDLAEAIEGMEWMDGEMPIMVQLPVAGPGMMDFSAGAGMDPHGLATAMTVPVLEGGSDDRNRWSVFNQVAGHYIHCARLGSMSLEEAKGAVHGWMLAQMSPPWPEPRFETEWAALLNKDVAAKGPMAPAGGVAGAAQAFGLPEPMIHAAGIEKIETVEDMLSWAAARRSSDSPKPRVDLVTDMIVAGQRHLLVAEGGAGKTFLSMDLALKVASSSPEYPTAFWLGQMVSPEAHDATAIMFTAEDNQDALDRRWHRIDPGMKLRRRAGERLIVIPMDNIGGSFPLVMNKPHGGGAVMATPEWARMVSVLYALRDSGRKVGLVIIDTLNATLHGEESSAEIIAQYMRALAPVTAELGAALVITHHVRKVKDDRKVTDAEGMLDAIRGSAAIKDNVRVAIGIWRAPDYKRRLRLMGLPEEDKRLYCAEVVKSNEPMYRGTKYLLRQDTGLLEDISISLAQQVDVVEVERMAWLHAAITAYAEREDWWFVKSSGAHSLFEKRALLPEILRELTRKELIDLADRMLNAGILVHCYVNNASTKTASYLDTNERRNQSRRMEKGDKSVQQIDWSRWWFNQGNMTVEER